MRILITILSFMTMSGCTGMLLGGDVTTQQPASETEDDDKSRRKE